MPNTKDCPLCGGTMRIRESKTAVQVPGNPKPTMSVVREWVCPDCDYYEDLSEEEGR